MLRSAQMSREVLMPEIVVWATFGALVVVGIWYIEGNTKSMLHELRQIKRELEKISYDLTDKS